MDSLLSDDNSPDARVLYSTYDKRQIDSALDGYSVNDDSEPGLCDTVVININGLNEEHADLKSVQPSREIKFPFKPDRILRAQAPDEEIKIVAAELLKLSMDSIKNVDEGTADTALAFVARDLGGSVLKQALLEASHNPEFQRILQSTTLLVFSGTPHRSSPDCQWVSMLSKLLHEQSTSRPGSWAPSLLQDLSAFHEDLAAKFDVLLKTKFFNIVNFFQEQEPGSDKSGLLVPRFSATLDNPGETQVALRRPHDYLGAFYAPQNQRLVANKISDVKIGYEADYQASLRLLSNYGLSVPARQHAKPIYEHLCDCLFADYAFVPWFGRYTTLDRSKLLSLSGASPVSRRMIVLELGGAIRETTVLTSSLIASIRNKRPNAADQFITLAHHYPRVSPFSKAQLMASVCYQILRRNPGLFPRIRPALQQWGRALRGHNTAWKEAVLWKILKTLLSDEALGQTFLIIHQPSDTELSPAFSDLVADIFDLTVKSTEIHCRILVVRKPPSTRTLAGCPLRKKDIDYGDPEVKAALEQDFTGELSRVGESNLATTSLRAEAVDLLLRIGRMDLQTAQICCAMLREIGLVALNMLKETLSTTVSDNVSSSSKVLDLVTKLSQPWVRSGISWLVYAMRPMTRGEFEEALGITRLGSGISTETVPGSADELARLSYGLVEVEGDVVYVADPELCRHFDYHTQEQKQKQKPEPEPKPKPKPKQKLKPKQKRNLKLKLKQAQSLIHESPQQTQESSEGRQSDAHVEIAQTCLAYLVKYGLVSEDGAREPLRKSMPPLLPYAVEHWFSHLKISERKTTFLDMADVVGFLANQDHVNGWMKWRASCWASDEGSLDQETIPSFETLAEGLGLQTSNAQDMTKVIDLVVEASTIKGESVSGIWNSMALAAAQTGNIEALRRLHLKDEATVEAVFETGSDNALCSLIRTPSLIRSERMGPWILRNFQKVIRDAILTGKHDLTRLLQTDFGTWIESSKEGEKPLIYCMMSDGVGITSDLALEVLKEVKVELGTKYAGRTILHAAASSGHTVLFQKLLSPDLPLRNRIDQPDNALSLTPLHLAAANGHFDIVKQLLEAGASVDPTDGRGQTPLHLASSRGYTDSVQVLLEYGASLSSQDKENATPLHRALQNGHGEAGQLLLNQLPGPSSGDSNNTVAADLLNTKDSRGLTPLLIAVKENLLTAVTSLVGQGADVNVTGPENMTSLHYAASFGFYEVLAKLLSAKDVVVYPLDNRKWTPVHWAAYWNHIRILKKLLEHGDHHDKQDSKGPTPLAIACGRGHAEAARMLYRSTSPEDVVTGFFHACHSSSVETLNLALNAGVDINSQWEEGRTALHITASRSRPRLVELLLSRNADLNKRNSRDETPLAEAVQKNAPECVKLLADAGADLNAEDKKGFAPLYQAAKSGYLECVRILLDANAELKVPANWADRKYSGPVDIALGEFNREAFEIVIKHLYHHRPSKYDAQALSPTPDVVRRCLENATFSDIEKIKILLDHSRHSWDPNETFGDGSTTLHYAVLKRYRDLVDYLIRSGRVKWDERNEACETPLEIAAGRECQPDIVNLLLEAGASAHIGSMSYGTPLHAAAYMYMGRDVAEEQYLAIAQDILAHGSSVVNLDVGHFGTPLHAAAAGGSLAMVKLLLRYDHSLSTRTGSYETPLHAAAAATRGNPEIINYLMSSESSGLGLGLGLGPGTADAGGRLPIHYAAIGNQHELIAKLTTPEISLLTRDHEGRHSLHFAAGHGSADVARIILEQHPEAVNDVDESGWTPLHWACRRESPFMVELLLEYGASKDAKTKLEWLPIHVAMYHGFKQLFDLVKTGNDQVEVPQPTPETELADEQEKVPPTRGLPAILRTVPLTEYYRCDSCYCNIYGPWRRSACHNFNLCFKCFSLRAKGRFRDLDFELWTPPPKELVATEEASVVEG